MISFITFTLTILFIIAVDIKKKKAPFDKENLYFDLYDDWFNDRWDDAIVWIIGGAIGAILSSELANPIINKYLDWPELAESSIDLTSVAICTLLGAKILEKLLIKRL